MKIGADKIIVPCLGVVVVVVVVVVVLATYLGGVEVLIDAG
jgi:hypothetical protein